MEWNVNDKYGASRIQENSSCLELKKWLHDYDCCQVTLSECSPVFWLTSDEFNKIQSHSNIAIGFNTIMQTPYHNRPILDDKNVVVNIQLVVTKEQFGTINKLKFNLTPNLRDEVFNVFKVTSYKNKISYQFGVYPREGFNYAYQQVKKISYINEIDFAKICDEWDKNLVDVQLYDPNIKRHCIYKYNSIPKLITDPNKYNLTMSFLAIDIEKNLNLIKFIFTYCKL
jgi:hypothetical protein